MNTSALKKFAQTARNRLLEDVSKRFLYWGFDKTGQVLHELEATSGGYLFRGDAYNDTSIPAKWNALVSAVGRHTVNDIIEEAAYTWFNRLMAIKVLEQNGYNQPMLAYAATDLQEPVILRNAKKGIYPTSNPQEIQSLKRKLTGANDDEALAALLISYCRNHQLLNRIFGHLDDYTELLIPGALLAKGGILELINDDSLISEGEYQEVELIGWLYQFYISDKKDDVFASFKKKKKARAEDIPAATQIFTPKWIVKYLVENTVGRLWLDLHPESPIRETMKYLVEPEEYTPDDPIIQDVTELKVLDPAVGSGHFLVVAFDLLMQMYLEEGYSKRKAVEAIIEHNLYGLDICPRATGLANFAILLKAAQHHGEALRGDHYPQVYAMPESFDFSRDQVQTFLGSGGSECVDEVHAAFKTLKQGQNIGSALILNLSDTSRTQLLKALNRDRASSLDLSDQMILKRMRPFAEVASILTDHFSAVVANPPYMGNRNMNADLADYLKTHYPKSKSDLFAVFIELMINKLNKAGYLGCITMESWMFLSSYEKMRGHLLNNYSIRSLSHFGWHIIGIAFGTVATVFQKEISRLPLKGVYSYLSIDDIDRSVNEPLQFPKTDNGRYAEKSQSDFSKIPGSPIAYWVSARVIEIFEKSIMMGMIADPMPGLSTTNNNLFLRFWYEVSVKTIGFRLSKEEARNSQKRWFPHNKGGDARKWYGNNSYIVNWENNGEAIKKYTEGASGGRVVSEEQYFNESISASAISSTKNTYRFYPQGAIFDVNFRSIFIAEKVLQSYILAFMNSKVVYLLLEILSPTLALNKEDIKRLPVHRSISEPDGKRINYLTNKNIDFAKEDWDSSEISYDFTYSPLINEQPSIAASYTQWEKKVTSHFFQLHENEEELNRIFIDIYGLVDEVTPDVEICDITILQGVLDEQKVPASISGVGTQKGSLPLKKNEVIKQLLSYALGCFFGRFRLDVPGLRIAHPNPTLEELSSYSFNGYTFNIDDDAIIPMMGSESPFSDDIVQRVQQFVLMVWGEKSYTENLNFINEALGEDLEKFLAKKFWAFHKKMYKKRPIYWQFASPKGAFKVLTYMHRMNRFTVQKIRQNYLFKQINYLESEITRLAADEVSLNSTEARKLDRFRSNLLECRDYDLLLKDVADRQIEFDLDDGVVENYKLFEGVVSKI